MLSTTTLTKDSAPELAHIQDRNPLLLTPDTFEAWLDPHIIGDQDLLDAISQGSDEVAAEALFAPVSPRVGKVSENDPSLILPL